MPILSPFNAMQVLCSAVLKWHGTLHGVLHYEQEGRTADLKG